MNYLGDFAEDETIYIPFNTFSSDDPSASATITNLADADIKVHKDGNATELVTDGASVAIDFAGETGNHLVTIDTSVHADYATGSDYLVRVEGTTVDGATINAWVGHFSIENRFMRGTDSAYTGTPPTTTEIEDAVWDATATDHVDAGSTGYLTFNFASVLGNITDTASAGDPTGSETVIQYLKQTINTLEGTAGIPVMPAAAAPANDISIARMIRAIYDDTAEIGTAGDGLTDLPTTDANLVQINGNATNYTRSWYATFSDIWAAIRGTSSGSATQQVHKHADGTTTAFTVDTASDGDRTFS